MSSSESRLDSRPGRRSRNGFPGASLLLACALSFAAFASAETISVQVERVVDGDTFHGRVRSGTAPRGIRYLKDSLVSIRLEGIDAPEQDQPWGNESRNALSSLASGRIVKVEIVDVDRFRRIVGFVRADGLEVNEVMVEGGNAWMFRRYTSSRKLDSLERASREAGRGLWSTTSPVEPWVWRKQKRKGTSR